MVYKYYIDHKKLNNLYKEAFDRSLEKTEKLLNKRWVAMQDNWHFDNENATFWQELLNKIEYKTYNEVKDKIKLEDLPTVREAEKSLLNHENNKPFKVTNSFSTPDNIYGHITNNNYIHRIVMLFGSESSSLSGAWYYRNNFSTGSIESATVVVPFKRLFKQNSEKLEPRVVLFLWLLNKWIPKDFENDEDYSFLRQFEFEKG